MVQLYFKLNYLNTYIQYIHIYDLESFWKYPISNLNCWNKARANEKNIFFVTQDTNRDLLDDIKSVLVDILDSISIYHVNSKILLYLYTTIIVLLNVTPKTIDQKCECSWYEFFCLFWFKHFEWWKMRSTQAVAQHPLSTHETKNRLNKCITLLKMGVLLPYIWPKNDKTIQNNWHIHLYSIKFTFFHFIDHMVWEHHLLFKLSSIVPMHPIVPLWKEHVWFFSIFHKSVCEHSRIT